MIRRARGRGKLQPSWLKRAVAIVMAVLACHAGEDVLAHGLTSADTIPEGAAIIPSEPSTQLPAPQTTPPESTRPTPLTPSHDERPRDKNWLPVAAVVGVIAIGLIYKALDGEKAAPRSDASQAGGDAVEALKRSGPMFAPALNMSAFYVRALVKGGSPVVIDYELGEPGAVELKISARGVAEIYFFDLSGFGIGRHDVKFVIPADLFGSDLRPALIAVTATDAQRRNTLAKFKIHGMGIGPRAVGSVGIDQVSFGPPRIRVAQRETAAYQFHSLNDFGNTSVEFMKVEPSDDGSREYQISNAFLGPVRKDQWIGATERREWDGTSGRKAVSTGRHKLRVRVWDVAGDWVASWSNSLVEVTR